MWELHGAEDDLCKSFDGQVWEEGSPDMKHPIEDTHPHCKCTLEEVDENGFLI